MNKKNKQLEKLCIKVEQISLANHLGVHHSQTLITLPEIKN